MIKIYKPKDGYPSFYQPYLDLVLNDGNLIQHLKNIKIETEELISGEMSNSHIIIVKVNGLLKIYLFILKIVKGYLYTEQQQ